jgi:hypothetical protein
MMEVAEFDKVELIFPTFRGTMAFGVAQSVVMGFNTWNR